MIERQTDKYGSQTVYIYIVQILKNLIKIGFTVQIG